MPVIYLLYNSQIQSNTNKFQVLHFTRLNYNLKVTFLDMIWLCTDNLVRIVEPNWLHQIPTFTFLA